MKTNSSAIGRKIKFWAGILLAQFLLFYIASKMDVVVTIFADFFEIRKTFHQSIFSTIPISVGDIFYILLFIIFGIISVKIFKNKQDRTRNILMLLIGLNAIYFSYQIFWGMLYFQKPLEEKLPKTEITDQKLKRLTFLYLDHCKEVRLQVKEDKQGIFKLDNMAEIQKEILQNQKNLPININKKHATEQLNFKPSLFKGIMNYTGILGYYNPFTTEAQYNADLPATYLPFTLAHESAHQLGYAREQEANFIGYLLSSRSINPDMQYSASYFTLKSLLHALATKNPDFVEEVIANFSPEMKRDRQAEIEFRQRHAGILEDFFAFTNDLFLKSNQQDGSITYTYFINLLVRYHDQQVIQ